MHASCYGATTFAQAGASCPGMFVCSASFLQFVFALRHFSGMSCDTVALQAIPAPFSPLGALSAVAARWHHGG